MKTQIGKSKMGLVKGSLISKVLFFCLFISSSFRASAQMTAADILGNYVVPSKDGAIQIYEKDGKYYGKIILNKDPEKLDLNNPDKEKQKLKVLGMTILNGFKFDGDDAWENGTIYDPKNGKTYSCKITRLANGDLNIRGFIGVSLLGRTETFTKIVSKD
jgi:uncharacterized protein (DUF2147 family)